MDEVQVTEALLRAVLELIDKCDTLDELRESVKRIVGDDEAGFIAATGIDEVAAKGIYAAAGAVVDMMNGGAEE